MTMRFAFPVTNHPVRSGIYLQARFMFLCYFSSTSSCDLPGFLFDLLASHESSLGYQALSFCLLPAAFLSLSLWSTHTHLTGKVEKGYPEKGALIGGFCCYS